MEHKENLRQRKFVKTEKTVCPEIYNKREKTYEVDYVPNSVGYIALFVFLLLLRLFYIYENTFPLQLTLKDANTQPGRFNGERAELQLKRLTDLGTRVVGSYENEILAVDFLKREISFIAQIANKVHKIDVDIQKPTGSYYLYLRPYGFRNYYANIQNIVVKLSSGNSTESVLLNCHYDTVPESPGASDNGINCVIMLEILRVLSSRNVPLRNNVIFLFNGAEENPLQASHGFVSQHKWNREVKVVINLDSAGSGGKEILFQTSGEPWLINSYQKSVPRPSAAVQGEELFQFGFIPSDTDFRIFRDFGNYSGLDFAHAFNGYVYHTKYDKMQFIRPGVYQFTGDNILALTTELAQSTELSKSHEKTKFIYFDVFHLFLISYPESVSVALNLVTAILSLLSVLTSFKILPGALHSKFKYTLYSFGGYILAVLFSAAIVFVVSKTLDFYKSTMSWYLNSWLIIPIYVFPILVAMTASFLLTQNFMKNESCGHKVILFINGNKLFWTVVLLIGTLLRIRSSFTIMLIILPTSVGALLIATLKKLCSVKFYFLTHIICLIFPVLYQLYQVIKVMTIMIPMTARMGPHTNPEIVIGALSFLTTSLFFGNIVPFITLLKKLKSFLISLSTIHIIFMIGIMYTNYGFPYSGNPHNPAVQRFYIFHCERTFYDVRGSVRRTDSGIFVQSLDRNNLNFVSKIIPELENARSVSEDCKNELYCGFPVFTSRFILPAAYSAWVPASPPTIHHPTSLKVINQTQVSVNVRRITFLVTGPDHITIVLSPRQDVHLIKWSFDTFEPRESQYWNGRPTYMIYHSHGLMGGTIEFNVDLEINKTQSDSILDVAVVGHYMHDKKFRTAQFRQFLSRFPSWAHLTPWTTTYKSWIL